MESVFLYTMGAYVQLEKSLSWKVFSGGVFQLERLILSWKEPFEVGMFEMKLETTALIGKKKVKLETSV